MTAFAVAFLGNGFALSEPLAPMASATVVSVDLAALRDRLLLHVLRDRPAEATLLMLGLNDLSTRAAAGDEMARHALEALQADRVSDALATIEDDATRSSAKDAPSASDLWDTAGLIRGRGDWAGSVVLYEKALALAPNDLDGLYGHAKALIALARPGEARLELTRLIASTGAEPSLFYQYWARLHLATLEIDEGHVGAAQTLLRDIDGRIGRFVTTRPIALDWERDLAVAWHKLGLAALAQGDGAMATAADAAGLRINERLVAADAGSGQWLHDLSVGQRVAGDTMLATGDAPDALAIYEKSLAVSMRGIASLPDVPIWRKDAAAVAEKIADLLIDKGELDRARTLLEQAIGVANWQGRVLKETDGFWHEDAARREAKLAALYDTKLHDLPHAIYWYDALRSLDAWLVRVDPENRPRRRDLAAAYRKLGDVQARNGDGRAASESFVHVVGIDAKLVLDDPADMPTQKELASTYEMFGDAAVAAHDETRALDLFKLAVATRVTIAKAAPADAPLKRAAALASEKLGDAQSATGDKAAALQSYRVAVVLYDDIARANPGNASDLRALAVALNEVGCIELATGDKVAALSEFSRRQHLMDAVADAAPDDLDKQHERFLSAFQLNSVLSGMGRQNETLNLLRATRANATRVLTHRPQDDVASNTLAWIDEEVAKHEPATHATAGGPRP